ncbi:MAG: hypothetical protein Q3X91_13930, partial [Bilophila sp.]|nr:hypothetical protein [Bilophila sp.]
MHDIAVWEEKGTGGEFCACVILDKTTASTFFQITCQEKNKLLKIARKTRQANKEKTYRLLRA